VFFRLLPSTQLQLRPAPDSVWGFNRKERAQWLRIRQNTPKIRTVIIVIPMLGKKQKTISKKPTSFKASRAKYHLTLGEAQAGQSGEQFTRGNYFHMTLKQKAMHRRT